MRQENQRCMVCRRDSVGVETAEVGFSGNWMRGPLCRKHIEPARRYGRVGANYRHNGERVEKPGWAEDWRHAEPQIVTTSEMDENETPAKTLDGTNYNHLKQRAAELGLNVGTTPEKEALFEAVRKAGGLS